MEIFVVSFIVFAGVALLLLGSQRLRKAPMPVGCRPAGESCCRLTDGQQPPVDDARRRFGNCIEPSPGFAGNLWGPVESSPRGKG